MNKRFNEKPFGVGTRCSIVLAIAEIIENLLFNKSIKQFCIFYFSKAFDFVNHDLMIKKLENYGCERSHFELVSQLFLEPSTDCVHR